MKSLKEQTHLIDFTICMQAAIQWLAA